jgi:DNA repair exonuclease SbcCD ATPase subunit
MPATQEWLEKEIGMSYEGIVNTIVFTDNNNGSFLECDTPTKRLIVENLLSLGPYREYLERAKKVRNSHKEKIDALIRNYEQQQMELEIAQRRIGKIAAEEEEWRKNRRIERDAIIRRIKVKQEEISRSDAGARLLIFNEAQEEIRQINESLPGLQENLDRIKSILESVRKKQTEIRQDRSSLIGLLENHQISLARLNSEIQAQQKTIDSYEAQKDMQCSNCLGIVSEANYGKAVKIAREKIISRGKEVEEINILIANETKKLEVVKSNENTLENTVVTAEKKTKDFSDKVSYSHRRLAELIKVQKPEVSSDERVMQEQITELKKQALAKDGEANGVSPYVEIMKSGTKEVQERSFECTRRKSEVEIVEKELPYYEFWVKAFGDSGIRKFVIDGIIPALNSRIAYWLQFLIDSKIKLTFDNELNETIENNPPDGDPFIYYAMSGGERRRLNLAVSQAFAYVMMLNSGTSPSLVFLDEVTSNIDPQGVEGVYNMIQELAKDKQVFVTTHDHDLLDILTGCKSINLVRKDGFTRLV